MLSHALLNRLHRLIWTLIYGGLLVLVTGLAAHRLEPAQGWAMALTGGGLVLLGVLLIVVRSRLGSDDSRSD